MNTAIIVGQYPHEAIEALTKSNLSGFMTETDLSIVSWPLSEIQTSKLHPICKKGNQWVIATQEDFLQVKEFLIPYDKEISLQKLASLLRYHKVRQYLNYIDSGYSHIEREIVEKLLSL